jgi:hypothetical protein
MFKMLTHKRNICEVTKQNTKKSFPRKRGSTMRSQSTCKIKLALRTHTFVALEPLKRLFFKTQYTRRYSYIHEYSRL